MCKYGTSQHGLAGKVVLGWWLDLMIIDIIYNLNDFIVLWWSDLTAPTVVFADPTKPHGKAECQHSLDTPLIIK